MKLRTTVSDKAESVSIRQQRHRAEEIFTSL